MKRSEAPGIAWIALAGIVAVGAGFCLGRLLRTTPRIEQAAGGREEPVSAGANAPEPPGDLLPGWNAPPPATAGALVDEVGRVGDHLVQSFPASPDAMEIKARVHAWLGDSEQAARTWKECLKADPRYAYAWIGLASLAAKKGNHQEAAERARKAVDAAPGEFQARALLADALIQQRRAQDAIPVLEDFLKKDPRSQGYYLLGQAYYQLEQYDKAREHYEAAVRMYPDYAAAYHGLTLSYRHLGQREKAEKATDKFREFAAPQRAAQRVRGVAESDLAIMQREAAVLYAEAGRVYVARNRPAEAERLWRRAAVLDAKNLPCRQSLAWLCRQQGRTREAAEWLQNAAHIEPHAAGYWLEIGRLREELLDDELAEKALRRACELAPRDGAGHAALAEFFLRTGRNLPEALPLARRAVEQEPSAAHYAVLAAASRRAGDQAGALRAAEKAAKLAPEDPAVRTLYESLKAK